MTRANEVCGCGIPAHHKPFWHRTMEHECIHHNHSACKLCRMFDGIERRLRAEIEHGPFVVL